MAAIALPAYQRYVKDARLKQAASALQDNAHALERFYAQHKSFKKNSTTWADLAVKQNDYFCFRMQGNARGALPDNFTVKAVALNKDSEPEGVENQSGYDTDTLRNQHFFLFGKQYLFQQRQRHRQQLCHLRIEPYGNIEEAV